MRYNNLNSLFKGICDAIREKDGATALISHQDIPARIAAISGGEGVGCSGLIETYEDQTVVVPFVLINKDSVTEEEIIWNQES